MFVLMKNNNNNTKKKCLVKGKKTVSDRARLIQNEIGYSTMPPSTNKQIKKIKKKLHF